MHPVKRFVVKAAIPEKLEPLREVAYNLWWYWHVNSVRLFHRLDPDIWERVYHNPVALLGSIPQEHFEQLAADEGIVAEMERIHREFTEYMESPTWFSSQYADAVKETVAYFSLEFGLSEAVPIYSGGLGILAGDHLKSASDLGVPLVGMGLLYQKGYFKQYLNNDGWQGETTGDNDFFNMPLELVKDTDGNDLTVEIEMPGSLLKSRIWKINVGRVPLFLLDTNIPENSPADRRLTSQLYGGDQEMRLRQEMLLGIGGLRALNVLGRWPMVCHMNEGHAAFLALERIRTFMDEDGMTYDEAFELASAGNVFTTHTPVAAGHDRFHPDLVLKYFRPFIDELGLSDDEFLALGRMNPADAKEQFTMTVLALKCADKSNAVSRLHMHVSREMWEDLWPGFPREEVPIQHVTNGVHVSSWVSQDMVELFERYVGPKWRSEPATGAIWDRVMGIPDEEIWRSHERRRERLVTFVRRRLEAQHKRLGSSETELNVARGVLNSNTLTIGFARRFASYKRADLIFRDQERLAKILNNPDRPVQLIIAGKAHPRDDEGKAIIRRIVHITRRPDIRRHVVFIEDYDMCVARYLVQGVDVWLNNPRRPLEASGTSGMKAAANGAINFSILDGWWDEAYTPDVGWAIGSGEQYKNSEYQDNVEADAIYDILEKEIVPLFYDTSTDNIPRGWIQKMKTSMSRLIPRFNTDRMVHQYVSEHYLPACGRFKRLKENDGEAARTLSLWRQNVLKNWSSVAITSVESDEREMLEVGDSIHVRATVNLGKLTPDDVSVQLYAGSVDASDKLVDAEPIPMKCTGKKTGPCVFEGELPFMKSGRIGYNVRVVPYHSDLISSVDMMLITWADGK